MFDIDFHSHILPGIDDGARSVQESCNILRLLFSQGLSVIVGTPHFRMHKHNILSFCQARQDSFEALRRAVGDDIASRIFVGAEVAIEYGLSEIGDPSALAYEGTNYLLMELPYRPLNGWMLEEITNIQYDYMLTPVIAHIDRYTQLYSYDDYCQLFSLPNVIFQINNEAFLSKSARKVVQELISRELPFVLGSDSHNTQERKPNFDISLPYLDGYCPHEKVQQMKSCFLA